MATQTAVQDNNPQATQAANASYAAANPNTFSGSSPQQTTPAQEAQATTPTPTPTNQPITTPQQGLQAAQNSGTPPPQTAGAASAAIQQFQPTTPTFYKPSTAIAGYDPSTVFDATGKPLSYDQFIAAGGKKDFSNVTAGSPPNQNTQQIPPQAGVNDLLKSSVVDQTLQADPAYQQLLADKAAYDSTANQTQSLVDTYKQMSAELGIPAMNTELMNMKNIIDGSEDDIRAEVTKAGGFATESQVMALTDSRNKQLIKNYNNLLQTKQDAMNTLTNMTNLAGQDRQFALSTISAKLQIDSQIADYQMKMQDNATQRLNNIVAQVGYAGLAQMTGGDPYYTSLVEKTLGLGTGGLAALANFKKPLTELEQAQLAQTKANTAMTQAQIAQLPLDQRLKEAQIAQTKAQTANIYSEIASRKATNPFEVKATPTDIGVAQIIASNPGQWGNAAAAIDKQFGIGTATKYDSWLKAVYQNGQSINNLVPLGQEGTKITPATLAQAKSNIDLATTLANDKNLQNVVGTNIFGRGFLGKIGSGQIITNPTSGGSTNFLAGVQQLTSQLTLDNLIRAKAQGATFGALSEGELNILAGSASKLNNWAIKNSSGQVTGYNTSESNFRTELDKINNLAKMDYILKGGNPADVGVQQMPDGTFWNRNSDGTMTSL